MNCGECQEQFEHLLGDRPVGTDRAAIEAHLRSCPVCAAAFAREKRLWDLLACGRPVVPSAQFVERVMRRLDERDERHPAWAVFAVGWWRWGFAVTALAVLITVGGLLWQRQQDQERFVRQFEDLFAMVQQMDTESLLFVDAGDNGDSL